MTITRQPRDLPPCALCGRSIAVNGEGEYRLHGPKDRRCGGSGMTPEQVATFVRDRWVSLP